MTDEMRPKQETGSLFTGLLGRADKEPLGVDISDYSDEFCAGFLAGQKNALEQVEPEIERYETVRQEDSTRLGTEVDDRGEAVVCPSCGRQPIGSHRPSATRRYLCPYCNETAVLQDEGVVVDSFTNVCREECLTKALRV